MRELTNYLKTSFNKRALFDTGILADFLIGEKKAKSFFEEHVFSGELTPAVSTQSIAELFMAVRNKKEEIEIEQWLSSVFDISDLDYSTAKDAGLLKRGKAARTGDSIIAATAKRLSIPIVTTCPDHYRNMDVKIFKPY
jgi:predicted nucleic acid-binding protein